MPLETSKRKFRPGMGIRPERSKFVFSHLALKCVLIGSPVNLGLTSTLLYVICVLEDQIMLYPSLSLQMCPMTMCVFVLPKARDRESDEGLNKRCVALL